MEISLLQKQNNTLQSLYHGPNNPWLLLESDQMNLHFVDDRQEVESCCWNTTKVKPDAESLETTANRAASASCATKKRKAEFDGEETGDVKSEITARTEKETSANICSKASSKTSEAQKSDYIHVRARRGQATDGHSLAERARREKLSKKMKCLQDLVPGCNKVTGKAGMLDEIINYVQSLQKQVEFLSMKLASLNPMLDSGIDNFFAISTCIEYDPMQQEGATSCGGVDMAIDQSHMVPQILPETFLDPSCIPQMQQLSGWESDWQNLFNVGFH